MALSSQYGVAVCALKKQNGDPCEALNTIECVRCGGRCCPAHRVTGRYEGHFTKRVEEFAVCFDCEPRMTDFEKRCAIRRGNRPIMRFMEAVPA